MRVVHFAKRAQRALLVRHLGGSWRGNSPARVVGHGFQNQDRSERGQHAVALALVALAIRGSRHMRARPQGLQILLGPAGHTGRRLTDEARQPARLAGDGFQREERFGTVESQAGWCALDGREQLRHMAGLGPRQALTAGQRRGIDNGCACAVSSHHDEYLSGLLHALKRKSRGVSAKGIETMPEKDDATRMAGAGSITGGQQRVLQIQGARRGNRVQRIQCPANHGGRLCIGQGSRSPIHGQEIQLRVGG